MQQACEILGRRCTAPPLGLITVAALLPKSWTIRLINRNAEELGESDLAWADLVMTGGMLPQQADTLALIAMCKAGGKPVCVGGPAATSSPEIYAAADYLVLGEAEGVIDAFIAAFEAGEPRGVFESEKYKVDVTQSPLPRFDLLKREHYLFLNVQFSRGCPFHCEFCDIIELYGNTPRAKTNEQVLRELDALFQLNHRGHVDFVDDNLIGNKKALKRFLPALIEWQRERNYPFRFTTEASLNLADDAELLLLLREANFFGIFVGIESPDEKTLIHTRKKQNTRRDFAESVQKIYAAGMFVIAGFIVGFDTETDSVAEALTDCIEATGIPTCVVGLLTALPNTQLTRRLAKEGRLTPEFTIDVEGVSDQAVQGLNFVTLRPRADVMRDCRDVLAKIYAPDAYFARLTSLALALNRPKLRKVGVKRKSFWRGLVVDSDLFGHMLWRFARQQPDSIPYVLRLMWVTSRRNPAALAIVLEVLSLYLDLRLFSRFVIERLDEKIAALEATPQVERIAA
jgi:radical SAM superfamily enzyme YgiQ (UPF0313 family)